MSTAQITEQFDDLGAELPGSAELDAVRRTALARFSELGLPGRRVETWRYTELSSLADKDFSYVAPVPDSATLERASSLIAALGLMDDRPLSVFIDGHWIQSLSKSQPDSAITIETATPDFSVAATESALASLNTAFAAHSTAIRVSGTASAPLELVFIGTGRRLAPQFRLKIELAAGAKATVIQRFLDLSGSGESWLNQVADIEQGENSELTLYRLQSHQAEQYQTTLNRAALAAGAKLSAGSVELGGALVRNEFDIRLQGQKAHAHVFGMCLTGGHQHSDMQIVIDHQAPYTTSRQDHRAIVADSSHCVFNGKVIVQKDAQHIDARQRSDNLLLSAKAEVDTKPELEIYADQVVCSHGATVGELSEDQLFYLRARGIDAELARGILTTAFANSILDRFELEDFREHVRTAVHTRLPGRIES